MAFQDKVIYNSKTGQEIKFLKTAKDTKGEYLEMEMSYNTFSNESVLHRHPWQVEEFTVLQGELAVKIGEQVKVLGAGEKLYIPKNELHAMWNNSEKKMVVNWVVRPALRTEYFLETLTGLANDGKTDEKGMPHLLQVALISREFEKEVRIAKPPVAVQKILFLLLNPAAYLSGYRPLYKDYID